MHRLTNLTLVLTLGLVAGFATSASSQIKTGNASYNAIAQKCVAYLKSKTPDNKSGQAAIGAYALLKAGVSQDDPLVSKILREVQKKCDLSQGYKADNQVKQIYEAGVDAMLLEAANPDRYRAEIGVIASFLVNTQRNDGSWDYPNGIKNQFVGDTSMNQYAMLGLWAAQRANVQFDMSSLDRCAAWHRRKQGRDGGFAYHPGLTHEASTGGGNSTGNMSAGGAASLGIILRMLYPQDDKEEKKSGILESAAPRKKKPAAVLNFKPTVSKSAIEESKDKAWSWVKSRMRPSMEQVHKYYFFYTLERAAAFNTEKDELGWYNMAAANLGKQQAADGSFNSKDGQVPSTAFVLLFLLRPTAKLVQYKGGLLKASRGLPDNLAMGLDPDAKEKEKKRKLDPLEELLTALEKTSFGDTSDKDAEARAKKQAEIVQKIQNGDREELVGQIERLKGLAKHPHPDVRRTALWAIGRSGDLMMVPLLIKGLQDVDVSVMIEARNGLCCVSRRANGFDLPANPLEEMETASKEEKAAAAFKWSQAATREWQKWWFRVRPYDLRDDLEEASLVGDE